MSGSTRVGTFQRQHKFWFEISCAKRNGSLQKLNSKIAYIPVPQTRPKPTCIWLLFLWAGNKRAVLGGHHLCQMKRDISVPPSEMTRQVKVDHLQSWSWIIQSDQTEMVRSICCANRNFRNFGLNGKCPLFSFLSTLSYFDSCHSKIKQLERERRVSKANY